MRKSDEWVRQPLVDAKADEIQARKGCSFAQVKGLEVAEALGVEAGGAIYEKVRDWRRRREAEHAASAVDMPPQVEADFRTRLEHFSAGAMADFVRAVRAVGGTIDQAASLRIADAERRRDEAEAETADVLILCHKAETDRDAALARIDELERDVAEGRRREDRLTGRLEQCGVVASDSQTMPDASDATASAAGEPEGLQTEMVLPMAAAATADDAGVTLDTPKDDDVAPG